MITNINLFYIKITRWKLIGSIIFSRTVYTSFKRTDIISAQYFYIVQCAFLIMQIYFSLPRIARGKALRARQDNRTITTRQPYHYRSSITDSYRYCTGRYVYRYDTRSALNYNHETTR